LQWARNQNGPRIDWLNGQQGTAYRNMVSAFDSASSAHSYGDGASARMHATRAMPTRRSPRAYVQGRRDLVQQIRDAKERHEGTRPDFERAKSNFEAWRSQRDRANQEYQRARKEFFAAKDEHGEAKDAFQARLAIVRAERERRRSDYFAISKIVQGDWLWFLVAIAGGATATAGVRLLMGDRLRDVLKDLLFVLVRTH
jgi:hypothetical protein